MVVFTFVAACWHSLTVLTGKHISAFAYATERLTTVAGTSTLNQQLRRTPRHCCVCATAGDFDDDDAQLEAAAASSARHI
jgi:hypothetical protein